jgi:putative transposase
VPLEYSIGLLTCAVADRLDAVVLVGRVSLKIVYVLTCRILGLVVLLFRGDQAKDAELPVLRHEDAVLRRQAGRVRYEPADRVWFAAVARLVPRRRWPKFSPSARRHSWPGTAGWPRRSTTRAGGACPAWPSANRP